MSQDTYEDEIKSLIMTATWNTMCNMSNKIGTPLPHHDSVDELMEAVADEVYTIIWEYIKDPD